MISPVAGFSTGIVVPDFDAMNSLSMKS